MSRTPNPPSAEEAERIRLALQARDDAIAEVQAAVVAAVRNGGSIRTVAELAAVSTSTVQRWLDAAP
jgi:transposase